MRRGKVVCARTCGHTYTHTYIYGLYVKQSHCSHLVNYMYPLWFGMLMSIKLKNGVWNIDCLLIIQPAFYRVFNLKVDRILIWVIYLLRFTTCYIKQLTFIYSKCWKWCPFISTHLSTHFTMLLATFLSVLSFTSSMARVIFMFKILNISKKLCVQWA